MPTKQAAAAPWQELEEQAYHAFREWPLWLVLRERELADHQPVGRSDKRAPNAASAAERPERSPAAKEGTTE